MSARSPLDRSAQARPSGVGREPDSNSAIEFGDRARPVEIGVVPGVEDLAEDPLRPSIELGIGGGHAAARVVGEAQATQLAPVGGDVLGGRDRRMLTVLDRELLGGQPERVEAHRVQHVVARHPLEAGEHVGADETERVTDVQSGARRVREHVEHEQLLSPGGGDLGIGQRAGGVRRLEGVVLVPPVLPAQFDVLRELSRIAVWWCIGAGRRGGRRITHTGGPAYGFGLPAPGPVPAMSPGAYRSSRGSLSAMSLGAYWSR